MRNLIIFNTIFFSFMYSTFPLLSLPKTQICTIALLCTDLAYNLTCTVDVPSDVTVTSPTLGAGYNRIIKLQRKEFHQFLSCSFFCVCIFRKKKKIFLIPFFVVYQNELLYSTFLICVYTFSCCFFCAN